MNQSQPQTTSVLHLLGGLGDTTLYVLSDLGRMGLFLLHAVLGLFRRPFRFRELVKQTCFIGASSFTVIFFTAISVGMVLGLQGYYSLNKFGAEGMLGSAVSLSLVMELGPVLTALMVAGRAGSAMCALARWLLSRNLSKWMWSLEMPAPFSTSMAASSMGGGPHI